jgi:hypothetical protein
MSANGAQEAMRSHTELQSLAQQLHDAEERWCALNQEIEDLS